MTQQNKRWNLFARELEEILASRNLPLSIIDNRIKDIHPEKVRRLQQSLLKPKSFPVLNPEEIDLIAEEFDLSDEERVRLRAAVLATAIERMLMNRIDQDNALLASEQTLTILRASLQANFEQDSGLGSTRGDIESEEDDESDRIWRMIWNRNDQGNLKLQLSDDTYSYDERVELLHGADDDFEASLSAQDNLDEDWQDTEIRRVWHNEASKGRGLVRQRLDDIGAS